MARWLSQRQRYRLGDLTEARGRTNAFDAMRIWAAVAVLVSHALPLTGHTEGFGQESLGQIGVGVFFAISGFLVSRSWALDPRPGVFFVKRALRLMPALLVVLILSVFVLGPLVSTLTAGTYLGSQETWAYLARNAVLQSHYALPGVFQDVPYRGIVNGSLWTLPVEVKCYLLVAALGLVGFVGRRAWGSVLVAIAALALTVPSVRQSIPHGEAIANLPAGNHEALMLVGVFAMSSALFAWRDRVVVSAPAVLLSASIWAATIPLGAHRFATALLLPYWVISAGYLLSGQSVRRGLGRRDLSYGTYLYGFPVEQLVAKLLHPGPVAMVLVSLPVVLALAAMSWHLVERPALALKGRASRRRRAAQPALQPG